jgi:hypothetical protein
VTDEKWDAPATQEQWNAAKFMFGSATDKADKHGMTEDEWVQEALSNMPAMSEAKKSKLAMIFSEPPVQEALLHMMQMHHLSRSPARSWGEEP